MNKYIFGLAALALLLSSSALAAEVGRYQAVPLGDLLVILDTQEGSLWTCEVMQEGEKPISNITFQGKIGRDIRMEAEPPAQGPVATEAAGTGRAVVRDESGEVIRVIDQSSVRPSGWTTSEEPPLEGGDNQ